MVTHYVSMIDDESEQKLFEYFYEQYRCGMYQIAYCILHDAHLAEDITSEALIRIANNINKLAKLTQSQQKDYISIVVKHLSIDLYRKQVKSPEIQLQEDMPADAYTEEFSIGSIRYQDLLHAIDRLPSIYSEILKMRYLYQLTPEETAQLLNLSANTVNQRVWRAKSKLKHLLAKEHYFDEE